MSAKTHELDLGLATILPAGYEYTGIIVGR